jgi:hypothetical protein
MYPMSAMCPRCGSRYNGSAGEPTPQHVDYTDGLPCPAVGRPSREIGSRIDSPPTFDTAVSSCPRMFILEWLPFVRICV